MDRNPIVAIHTEEDGKKIFAKSPQLELLLGIAYYALEEYTKAVDTFLNAMRMDPAMEQPYAFLARTLEHAPSRLPEILAAFKALGAKTPDNYRSSYFYGKAHLLNGDDEHAETLLRKSVGLNGGYWESRLELAKALEQTGDLAGALAEFRKAIELNPTTSLSPASIAVGTTPQAYPIYDNVEACLSRYREHDGFATFHRYGYDHPEFVRRMNAFRDFYGLTSFTFKQLDKFLQ